MTDTEPYYGTKTTIKPASVARQRSVYGDADVLMFKIAKNSVLAPSLKRTKPPIEPYFVKQPSTRRLSVPDDSRYRGFALHPFICADESAIVSDDDDDLDDTVIQTKVSRHGSMAEYRRPPSSRNSFHRSVSDNFSPASSCSNSTSDLTPNKTFDRANFSITDPRVVIQRPEVLEDADEYFNSLFIKSNLPYIVTNPRSRALSSSLFPPRMMSTSLTKDDFDAVTCSPSVRDDFDTVPNQSFIV